MIDSATTNKVKWTRGEDFMDGLPRYTFEGRDPQNTLEDIQVVICKYEKVTKLGKVKYYKGHLYHLPTECGDDTRECYHLERAKELTLRLYYEYVEEFKNYKKVGE